MWNSFTFTIDNSSKSKFNLTMWMSGLCKSSAHVAYIVTCEMCEWVRKLCLHKISKIEISLESTFIFFPQVQRWIITDQSSSNRLFRNTVQIAALASQPALWPFHQNQFVSTCWASSSHSGFFLWPPINWQSTNWQFGYDEEANGDMPGLSVGWCWERRKRATVTLSRRLRVNEASAHIDYTCWQYYLL